MNHATPTTTPTTPTPPPTSLRIRPVTDRASLRDFIDLPARLYARDPLWVPPLRSSQFQLFQRRTPFFDHAAMELYLAYHDKAGNGGEPIARIAAIHNRAHNDHTHDTTGFFGFFECDPAHPAAAGLLLTVAEDWLRARGLTSLRGPVNPSLNAECGLLIDGFDRPPMALMPYNPPAYAGMLESHGLAKCKDLYAYFKDLRALAPGSAEGDRLLRLRTLLNRRHPEVTIRPLNMRRYLADVVQAMAVFEEARKDNWGYVPVTPAEIRRTAHELQRIVDPELVLLAEVSGRPAGAMLCIPNINIPLKAVGGRLFPFGFLRFFRVLKQVRELRALGGAALKEDRTKGITALLTVETLLRALRRGYHTAEISWVLEDNLLSNVSIQGALNPILYKTYRLFEKPISPNA